MLGLKKRFSESTDCYFKEPINELLLEEYKTLLFQFRDLMNIYNLKKTNNKKNLKHKRIKAFTDINVDKKNCSFKSETINKDISNTFGNEKPLDEAFKAIKEIELNQEFTKIIIDENDSFEIINTNNYKMNLSQTYSFKEVLISLIKFLKFDITSMKRNNTTSITLSELDIFKKIFIIFCKEYKTISNDYELIQVCEIFGVKK